MPADIPVVHVGGTVKGAGPTSTRWWKEAPDKLASTLVAVARSIEASPGQRAREASALLHARLYANAPISSLYSMGTRSLALTERKVEAPLHRINYNVVASCLDTAAAKISKNKTRALFLTSGGSWSQQQRSKKLTKYCDGLAEDTRIYEKGQRSFVDGGIFESGVLKPFADTSSGQVKIDRVLPCEILIDDTDAIYGEPRDAKQRKYAPRDLLQDAFGSEKTVDGRRVNEAIARATGGDPLRLGYSPGDGDMIPVYEAWHLRRSASADDGRHVIAIEGSVLFDEPWKRDYFPLPSFRWNTRPVGWWGQPLAEQLVGIQIEIGKLLRTIQRCQHLVSVPRILVEDGSEIIDSHINNETGAIVRYRGTKPEIWVANGVPPDLFAQLDRLVAKAYELTGISQLSANSKKPEGLDAAVALREFHDIESERFIVVAQRYEQMFLDAFRMMVDLSRDLYEKHPDLRQRAPGTRLLEEIAWKDVDLKEDSYVMRPYPTSILPTSPGAKLQSVQELYSSKMLSDQTPAGVWARSLLDFPDLESYLSLEQATLEDVRRLVGKIVDDGEYEPPDEFVPSDMLIAVAHNAYEKAKNDGLPEDRLEKLCRLMQEASDLASQMPAQQQAAPAPSPGAPAAAPAAPGAGAPAPGVPALPSELPALPASPAA